MRTPSATASTLLSGIAALLIGVSTPGFAADEDAAQALLKKSACLTCHATDKKKIGPSFKDTAIKYKGKADAQDKLVKHITTKPMIDMGGTKVEHAAVKSTDGAEIKNVVQWILSQ